MTSGDQESTPVANWGAIAGRKLVADGATIEAILAERPQSCSTPVAAQ